MTANANAGLVRAVLDEYGNLTRSALKQYLPSAEPRRYLYDLLSDYPNRGGKMMRPSLCIAAARLFGARAEDAINTAVAIELLHNALLIHDDIEDGSEERRGAPTLHLLHGVPLALNAGDTLILMAFEPLFRNRFTIGESVAFQIIDETQQMARCCAEGQAIELGWRRYNSLDIDDNDYFDMVLKKTCWLAAIYPLRAGALIGSGGAVDLEPLMRFGFFLGAAFQIQDDVLNLFADDSYGKELNGDLWEGKRTLMLIHAFRESSTDQRERVTDILERSREERTLEDVNWIRQLMLERESIDYARRLANQMAGAALHEYSLLSASLAESRDKEFLREIVTWVIERN